MDFEDKSAGKAKRIIDFLASYRKLNKIIVYS